MLHSRRSRRICEPRRHRGFVRIGRVLDRVLTHPHRNAAVGVPPIDPAGLSGRLAHWRADAGTFENTGLTTPAADDNDPLLGWQDQAGTGKHLTNGTAANAPILDLNQANGKPGAFFDGGDWLANAAFDGLSNVGGATLFVVFRAAGTAANQILFDPEDLRFACQISGNAIYAYGGTNSIFGSAAFTSTATTVYVSRFDGSAVGNAGRLRMWLNGVEQTLSFFGTVGTTISAGTPLAVGRRSISGLLNFTGHIFEIVPYGRALTVDEILGAGRFLGSKWGAY